MRAVGLVLAVAITLFAGFSLVQATAGSVSRTEHHSYPAPREIAIDADAGDVRIERAAGRRLVVDSTVSGTLRTPRLSASLRDGTLHLGVSCSWLEGRCDGSFVVRVPDGTAVTVTTDSGDLTATGLAGTASLRTDSGDIRIDGVTGALSLATDSGEIDAAGLRSADVTAHTDSGDVSLAFAAAPTSASASTDSGDVLITVPPGGAYDVKTATDSGDETADVRTDPLSGRSISVRTDSGDIALSYR